MQLKEHVALAPYTTFRIGGPARWFAEAATEADILEGVAFARGRGVPLFVLGGGSNLLVSDAGYPGLVLHIGLRGVESLGEGVYTVAAGEDWDSFVSQAVAADYAGLECLAGIPGSVGGTPVQNVGAYGQEVSQTIVSVRALDLRSETFVDIPASACGFAYRRSIFNGSERGRYIVSRVDYRLTKHLEPLITYPDLKQYFQEKREAPSLAEVASAVREIRRGKGMLLVDGDPDCVSAGSFFKNPVVAEAVLRAIEKRSDVPVPHYGAGPGHVKIPAAWLLEHAGFPKGYILGRAGISSRHTLALINRGGASAAEVLDLRDRIVASVESQYGIRLEPEPVLVS
ncbi:MAG TPA: UDP-N-acetylmuramate dehydrogenase [Acidisarcina sp.]|nr:UDP-N-acetylmuramate dehydrogenase [Acidisarcina sp.]